MPPLPADSIHARACKLKCEKILTRPLAALNNRDFVVWTGHFVSLLSLIGGRGGVLPPHFGQKKAGDLFQISCSVCRYVGGGYLIVKVRGKLTRCEADKLEFILANHLPL